jgi:YVTN family beta-propeller protein
MSFTPEPGRSLRRLCAGGLARLAPAVTAVAAALALGPAAPATAAAAAPTRSGPTAYVLNQTAGTMSAIDTATGAVSRTVNASDPDGIGFVPNAAAASPDGRRVYVVNNGDDSVSVIDTATDTVTARVPVGKNALGVEVSPTGRTVAAIGGDNVYLLHVNSLKATRLPKVLRPVGVAFSPDGAELYVASQGALMVFDTTANALVHSFKGTEGIFPVISPDGTTAYELSRLTGSVIAVNLATGTVTATIPLAGNSNGFNGLTLSPDGSVLYAQDLGTMNVIDTATDTVSTSYPAADHVVFSSDDAVAYEYAFTIQDTAVTAIDPATGAVVGSIPAAGTWLTVELSPDGTRAYVASANGVQVYDTATSSLIATVPDSAGLDLAAFAFTHGKAYLPNADDGT